MIRQSVRCIASHRTTFIITHMTQGTTTALSWFMLEHELHFQNEVHLSCNTFFAENVSKHFRDSIKDERIRLVYIFYGLTRIPPLFTSNNKKRYKQRSYIIPEGTSLHMQNTKYKIHCCCCSAAYYDTLSALHSFGKDYARMQIPTKKNGMTAPPHPSPRCFGGYILPKNKLLLQVYHTHAHVVPQI